MAMSSETNDVYDTIAVKCLPPSNSQLANCHHGLYIVTVDMKDRSPNALSGICTMVRSPCRPRLGSESDLIIYNNMNASCIRVKSSNLGTLTHLQHHIRVNYSIPVLRERCLAR